MSWMAKLYDTYETGMSLDLPDENKLMPISHTLQNAHINIVIDINGCFKRAAVLEKTQVVLPATEKSAGRSSGEAPHPLADKLQYIAKDYPEYGGRKKSYFHGYESQLAEWCSSEYKNKKAEAILNYIRKGQVIKDLISAHVLHIDESPKLMAYWPDEEDKNPPLIFKVLPAIPKDKRQNKDKAEIEPGDALVCWSVEKEGEPDSNTWKDERLQQSWIDYNSRTGDILDFCFITGNSSPIAVNHPAKLRHTGDKAKLISANDSSGFTFRGRFTDPNGRQATSISYEVTQKAHNALRWLISRQGFRNGDQIFVSWAISGKKTPEPLESTWDLLNTDPIFQEETEDKESSAMDYSIDVGESFSNLLNKYLSGYRTQLTPNEQIIIMGLDSATPGRMGIIYYRELLASEFLERVEKWHYEFAWPQRFTAPDPKSKKKDAKKTIWPISSPSPRNIAEAAYGNILKSNEKLKKGVIERILPCIVDRKHFPYDIVLSSVRRTCNRHNCEKWEWERNLGITCALYKGFYLRHPQKNKRREYKMALEEERTTRDYLYGRLLAIAEKIEETALYVGGEDRPTTAARLMQRFADRPFSTWRNIELALQPYMQRLKSNRAGFLVNRTRELDSIFDAFSPNEFTSEKPLSGEFLLGYHCQKQAWQNKSNQTQEKE
ncbi:type I-C CRISPR-associated protein Cas8c/Csd1 [uncultured Desulfobacter sp.]|uniref:type I-C CRISPR-associated protein Cas8c/Csd1 n=1 Tax=uncultured Desulfobacter sp. TaxID=240139 RepID=UPI002AA6BB44|nr:type I-C CRISPR-associated protein Cas8c/Csd1 [uncultured Desulfobacter sp.]